MTDHPKTGSGIAELLADKREEILEIAAKHGASNVRVFGSVARGEARPDSDIDFLVDWDDSRISAWGGVGLSIELEELLGRPVDVGGTNELYWASRACLKIRQQWAKAALSIRSATPGDKGALAHCLVQAG